MSETLEKEERVGIKKPSKVVILKRQVQFVQDANKDPEVKEYFDMAYVALGAYQKHAGGPAASGLTRAEEVIVMPELTGVYPDDGRKEFRDSVNNYFKNINTKIPPEGKKLEIALEKSGELSLDNLPVNVEQWVRWRHAVGHPLCASSKEDAEKYQHIRFYIEDTAAVVKSISKLGKVEDAARKEYFRIIEDRAKVVQILTLLGVPRAEKLDPESAELSLKGFSTIDPEASHDVNERKLKNFRAVATDKELAVKYDIMQLITAGILERVGNRILVKDSGEEIGVNLKDAAKWFLDKANVKTIGIWRAQLKEIGGKDMSSGVV